jgi:aminopeptidase N
VALDLTRGEKRFGSATTVSFRCHEPGAATFIEFAGDVHRAELNGRNLPAPVEGGRLRLEGLAAENSLTIEGEGSYSRDGTGITWFRDPVDGRTYLHSQFAEHVACLGYPCFDQPDLKATFDFKVKAPDGWVVVSNTAGSRDAQGEWAFPTTAVMSTYVTAVVAGEYQGFHHEHRGIPLGVYCRRSLAEHLDVDEIFDITRQGLDFFERRFGFAYPFGKYDQLFVPDFTSGAMENAACVTHNERMVFRSRVTDAERMGRAETILHEMAHMWFGDLVTMTWWDDLWLNESFAEYMGYLACVEATRFKSAWLVFANATKAGAKAQDQLPTTHPVVADIPDVESIKLNLDGITYNKGASVVKQLVAWVGEAAFFKGVESYFKAHAYSNTGLRDFLEALEGASGRDLESWSRLWLERAGVNTLEASLAINNGRVDSATLVQTAPADHPTLRPHHLRVGLFGLEGGRLRVRSVIDADVDGATTELPQLAGQPVPDLVLVNHDDLTYAKLKLDERSLETVKRHLRDMDDPLARALVWGALWDMTRDANMRAREFVAVSLENIDVETDAPTVEALIARIQTAITTFGAPSNRSSLRGALAGAARQQMESSQPGGDLQLLWAHALIRSARDALDVAWVHGLLDGTASVDGLSVDFDIRWAAVTTLVEIGAAGEELIERELARDPTDSGRRRGALARASRPDASAKQDAWRAVVLDGEPSLVMKRDISYGFHRVDQQELLRPYVRPFFESIMPVWESHDSEEAISIVTHMYPRAVFTQEVVEATDEALSADLPGPLKRALLESRDAVMRALRAQAFDGA